MSNYAETVIIIKATGAPLLWSPNVRLILISWRRDIMFIGSSPYPPTLYVFQRSCPVSSLSIFQIRNKIPKPWANWFFVFALKLSRWNLIMYYPENKRTKPDTHPIFFFVWNVTLSSTKSIWPFIFLPNPFKRGTSSSNKQQFKIKWSMNMQQCQNNIYGTNVLFVIKVLFWIALT